MAVLCLIGFAGVIGAFTRTDSGSFGQTVCTALVRPPSTERITWKSSLSHSST